MSTILYDSHMPPLSEFKQRLDLDRKIKPFQAHRWFGQTSAKPVLHLEDVSAIPFLNDIAGVEEYQHRARVRATDRDLYATATPVNKRYETYCQKTLCLGEAKWVFAPNNDQPLEVANACSQNQAFGYLVDTAREFTGLTIHPYMSIEDVWELAACLATESRVPVTVVGSPPPVTWIANDKALFTELVDLVLGPGWTVESHLTASPIRMAELLKTMSTRHRSVGLKRTRCASAMGNAVFDAQTIQNQAQHEILDSVHLFLERTEWTTAEPVLIVAWEATDYSPSSQWWIPPARTGPVHLDGIYEQILEGDEKVFIGSRPTTLPDPVNQSLAQAGRRVAKALQAIGYVGRCSFDYLVLGDPSDEFVIRFTECNGRWGGTSTPMHLVDRVVDGKRPPYRAQDISHAKLTNLSFGDILDRVGDQTFERSSQRGRYIFYNVGPLAGFGKLDVIALGSTQSEAEEAMTHDLPKLLGL